MAWVILQSLSTDSMSQYLVAAMKEEARLEKRNRDEAIKVGIVDLP